MFTVNVVRDVRNGTRTIQGIHRNQVTKFIGLQVTEVFLHTRTFKLERTNRGSMLVKFKRLFIVQRDGINIDFHTMILFDQGQGILDDGKGLQSQKVHLDYTGFLNHTSFNLGQP